MQETESATAALNRVNQTPPSDWTRMHEGDLQLERKKGEPLTQLLVDLQYDSESKSSFIHLKQRLENKQAVQELSQWRINFDPTTENIQLHHIRVIRGDTTREFGALENARIIQREENLDSYIIHGEVTLLIVLDNIRIGDIIDTCYTRTTHPQLLPNHFSCLQLPPNNVRTGYFHFSVRFPSHQPMQWKSGEPENKPTVEETPSHTVWKWEDENLDSEQPEHNTPPWELPKKWLQVSDMQDWSELSSEAYARWPREEGFELPQILQQKIEGKPPAEVIDTIIEYVQSEFRYLSVKTTMGGQIPNAPDKVLERFYGDCKDLSCLLTHLLETQDIEAQPMLVNSQLGSLLPELLPSASLFDHVVVEFKLEGQTYWVDPTLPEQGGQATGRFVPNFEYGLPLQKDSRELVKQPSSRTVSDRYEIHETIMLDTAKNHSILSVKTYATGRHADQLRLHLSSVGEDGFEEYSADRQKDRHETECAIQPVEYSDDRDSNTWKMVELYEIDFFKSMQHDNKFIQLNLPPTYTMRAIEPPEDKDRNYAYAIPPMLDVTHIVEVRSKTNAYQRGECKNFKDFGVEARIECVYKREVWTQTSHLKTTADHVPAKAVRDFRKLLSDYWDRSSWVITAPRGKVRLHRPSDFADLPHTPKASTGQAGKGKPTSNSKTAKVQRKPQRLQSHPDVVAEKEREAQREVKRSSKPKTGRSENRNGLMKLLTFWKN